MRVVGARAFIVTFAKGGVVELSPALTTESICELTDAAGTPVLRALERLACMEPKASVGVPVMEGFSPGMENETERGASVAVAIIALALLIKDIAFERTDPTGMGLMTELLVVGERASVAEPGPFGDMAEVDVAPASRDEN